MDLNRPDREGCIGEKLVTRFDPALRIVRRSVRWGRRGGDVRSPYQVFRASQTPATATIMPTSASPVSVSPNSSHAISAVVGGVR